MLERSSHAVEYRWSRPTRPPLTPDDKAALAADCYLPGHRSDLVRLST
jgi:hypothetical protein